VGHENRTRRRRRLNGPRKNRLHHGHSEDERTDHLAQVLQCVQYGHRDCSVVPIKHGEYPREQA
jgi:hypothetical protein